MWPQGATLPTADAPELAVVMAPRGGQAQADGQPLPTWVFPFNRPLPPGEGGNQAVTFQVVLILGDANIVVPENVAAAVNYGCIQGVTQALATQLVVTLSGPLSAQSMADLAELWNEISAFGAAIQGVPLSELQDRLTEYERQVLAIVQKDPAWVAPAPGGTATPSETSTTGAGATASPTTGATGSSTGGTPTGGTPTGGTPTMTGSSGSSTSASGPSSSSGGPTSPASETGPTASSTQPTPTSTASAGGVAEATATP